MGDASGFMERICAEPHEDTHRLAYADWLEEHSGSRACPKCRGGGERWYADHDNNDGATLPCRTCGGVGTLPDEHATFIRDQCYGREADRQRRSWNLHGDTWALPVATAFGFRDTPMYGVEGGIDYYGNKRYHHVCSDYASDRGRRVAWRPTRGFISDLTCAAEDWLKYADRVAWRPGLADECPECGNGRSTRPACPRCLDGNAKTRDGHAYTVCCGEEPFYPECPNCGGTGFVERPCPPAAQPIERVTLTTRPRVDGDGTRWRLDGRPRWFGGEVVASPGYGRLAFYRPPPVTAMLNAEWPHISFTLPASP